MKGAISVIAHPIVALGLSAYAVVTAENNAERARFAVAVPLSFAIGKTIKRLHLRQRPDVNARRPLESFPSDHAACIAAYALSVADASKRRRVALGACLAIVVVNIARVRSRKHWWSDVLAGNAIGLGSAVLGGVVSRLIGDASSRDSTTSRRDSGPCLGPLVHQS